VHPAWLVQPRPILIPLGWRPEEESRCNRKLWTAPSYSGYLQSRACPSMLTQAARRASAFFCQSAVRSGQRRNGGVNCQFTRRVRGRGRLPYMVRRRTGGGRFRCARNIFVRKLKPIPHAGMRVRSLGRDLSTSLGQAHVISPFRDGVAADETPHRLTNALPQSKNRCRNLFLGAEKWPRTPRNNLICGACRWFSRGIL
jgi:hypothetical protein